MRKVRIFASQGLGDLVFERIRDLELLQVKVTAGTHPGETHSLYQEKLQKLSAVKSYFERYNPVRRGFIDMFIGTKPEVTFDGFRKAVEEEDLDSVYGKVASHGQRLKEIGQGLDEVEARKQLLVAWRGLDIPVARLGRTASCDSVVGVVSASRWAAEEQKLAGKAVHWQRLWQKQDKLGLWLVSLLGECGTASSVVSAAGGSVIDLAQAAGASGFEPEEELSALEKRREDLLRERECILEADAEMSKELLKALALMDYFLDRKNLDEARGRAEKTAYTLVIDGFARKKDLPKLRSALADLKEVELVDEEPAEGDEVPVYLENSPLIRPFETVTNIFGFPRYKELDPTPWLAPFFWVYFGITLGDVFYGLILAAACCWLLKTKRQLSDGGRKLVTLLLYSSFSMIVVGVLTGSWFGDVASVFAPGTGVERFVKSLMLLDPVNDPLTLMVISLAMGIFQIWVGIGIKGIGLIRSGQVGEAIIAQGSWLLFLPGLVAWALSKAGLFQSNIPFYAMIAGALAVMYSTSRGQKNVLLKPFSGAYGLYGTISYLADTLSYSRLLALGLSSTIIALVINKIAQLVSVMIPVVGWALVPVVLLGGHAFNLMINLLGSFIHSGRLQFVEFFTKFFEGGGRPFKPLKRVNENVSLRYD